MGVFLPLSKIKTVLNGGMKSDWKNRLLMSPLKIKAFFGSPAGTISRLKRAGTRISDIFTEKDLEKLIEFQEECVRNSMEWIKSQSSLKTMMWLRVKNSHA